MGLIKGVVAAGHRFTAEAAAEILREGGNAFDAIVAAHLVACVAEPVLSSLAGGSFFLTFPAQKEPVVYDAFVQTPRLRRPEQAIDFRPISVDFGTAQQEFHIGLGSVATPGTAKGLFQVQRELCSMPMRLLVEPAVQHARAGVVINEFQAYIFDIVQAIFQATSGARKIYGSVSDEGGLLRSGEIHRQPEMADCLEAISREGDDLIYLGEIGARIVRLSEEEGGHLTRKDLESFHVIKRKALSFDYRNARIFTNPPPSSGGILIGFALKLLESVAVGEYRFGSSAYLGLLAKVQAATNKARIDAQLRNDGISPDHTLLDREFVTRYAKQIRGHPVCSRGTTHISVIDQAGNIGSATTSNGEGCGTVVPGVGIMLNNMLGEEDLNPDGFHRWPTNSRMTSMMAPTIAVLRDELPVAVGSGGSNRLRTAILQVLINLVDFRMTLKDSVDSPRIHFEQGLLNVESGFAQDDLDRLIQLYPEYKIWDTKNLFFGGAHSAVGGPSMNGRGDSRRGGVAIIVT